MSSLESIYSNVNIADIEDYLTSNASGSITFNNPQNGNRDTSDTLSVNAGGRSYDQYRNLGSFISSDMFKKYTQKILDESYRISGQGRQGNVMQNFLSRLDRHGTAFVPLNAMNYGYTFITRPRLNLAGGNLRQHPVMSTLYSTVENSVPFMIRALLDTKLCNNQPLFRTGGKTAKKIYDKEAFEFSIKAAQSGLVDVRNPFLTPLCNGLLGISGFPDFNIETETTEGDFHSGDYTFVKGSDMNNRTQELSLEFRDVQGSIILSILFYWCLTMALQAKGVMIPYPDDIYEQRLNYTVSIYRFITDPTRKNILWWAKATGCYPKSVPIGALFNVQQSEIMISSAMNFSIPFVANDVKVNDPGILMDFNRLMQSYCDTIDNDDIYSELEDGLQYNFMGLPYIKTTNTGLRLVWKTSDYLEDVDLDGQTLDEVEEEVRISREIDMETMLAEMTAQQEGEITNV